MLREVKRRDPILATAWNELIRNARSWNDRPERALSPMDVPPETRLVRNMEATAVREGYLVDLYGHAYGGKATGKDILEAHKPAQTARSVVGIALEYAKSNELFLCAISGIWPVWTDLSNRESYYWYEMQNALLSGDPSGSEQIRYGSFKDSWYATPMEQGNLIGISGGINFNEDRSLILCQITQQRGEHIEVMINPGLLFYNRVAAQVIEFSGEIRLQAGAGSYGNRILDLRPK